MSSSSSSRPVGKAGPIRSIVELAAVILVVIAAKTAIAEPFYVPSGSMEPTLLIGDELIATKYSYGYGTSALPSFFDLSSSSRLFASTPQRGDVIVFRWPGNQSQTWVKRVIGLPGDRIEMRNGVVWINGKPAKQTPDGMGEVENENGQYTPARKLVETLPNGRKHLIYKMYRDGPLDNMPTVTVPPGHLFVMGDDRDDSADSRVPLRDGGVGMLPMNNLVGKVQGLIGSWNLAYVHKPIWQWAAGLRPTRFFSAVH
ncbi:MAG TPA: signal peptidase I [Pseudolabrys sp.]|jgi:signal peptidase I|nr:signal peptidase I [Pseudolabrys sp.]